MLEATVLARRAPLSVVVRAYQELTKPGITLFVGLSAAAGYVTSTAGAVDPATLCLVALATVSMSAGAAALNQHAERHLDARMRRTQRRPLPAGLVSARAALVFGWTLTLLGALLATYTLPLLSAVFLGLCFVSYVYWYTPLKRSSTLCTLVGAIPGALPVLAGSAASGNWNSSGALALTALLFAWQIPHFFAIGWVARDDYARAEFRMLPVVDSSGIRTALAAVLFAALTQASAVILTKEAAVGPWVMAVVHTAGTAYVCATLPFLLRRDRPQARRLFLTSLLVLPIMLIAVMAGILSQAS